MTRTRLVPDGPNRWRIEPHDDMRVPGVVYASDRLVEQLRDDASLGQVEDVACLPGIVGASFAMPDVHRGYGFPIGGVAATDVDAGGVVSPGGVGFDISCGVRLHTAPVDRDELGDPGLERVMDALDATVPRGLGTGAVWDLSGRREVAKVLTGGARYAVESGFGDPADPARIEDGGAVDGAGPDAVSGRAVERGARQVGSLGSGNHFLEVQVVDAVLDPSVADAFGLREGQVCVMVHTGSRGLGHQVCQDHVKGMQQAMGRHGIRVPDKQLACVPVDSAEGRRYLGAMAASANFGRANRQLLGETVRDAFAQVLGSRELPLVFDVSHNLARIEEHEVAVDGRPERRRLCVHRKGATPALPPGHPDLTDELRPYGQPVLVPGSMGTGSWVLTGVDGNAAFNSTCHGAGRTMSRRQASKRQTGQALREELERAGVLVRPGSLRNLPEEAPYAYKDVEDVVGICEQAGLARRVARLRPVGVVKG